jgi:hypothetical protein
MAQPRSTRPDLNWLWAVLAIWLVGGLGAWYFLSRSATLRRGEWVTSGVGRVDRGMTEAEVRELVGEPDRVMTGQTDWIDTAVATTARTPPRRDKTPWVYDYVYRTEGNGRFKWKRCTVYFRDGRVSFRTAGLE